MQADDFSHYFSQNLPKFTEIMAPHRMKKAKRSPSFVAKSPFHQRRKNLPVFPIPVSAQDLDLSESTKESKNQPTTNYILEKIGTKKIRYVLVILLPCLT